MIEHDNAMQELGEVSASIRTALYRTCSHMPSYPVGIVEPHLAALHKRTYDQGYDAGIEAQAAEIERLRQTQTDAFALLEKYSYWIPAEEWKAIYDMRTKCRPQTDALKLARNDAIEECAALAEKLWLDGEPYSEVFDHIRALAAPEQSK